MPWCILSATAPILQIKFDGRFSSSVFTTTRHADGSMDMWIDEERLPYIVLYIHPWLTRLPTYVHQLLHDNLGALPLTSSRIHTIYCTPESISSDWVRGPSYAVLTSTLPQTHPLSSPRLLSMFKIFSRLHRSKIWCPSLTEPKTSILSICFARREQNMDSLSASRSPFCSQPGLLHTANGDQDLIYWTSGHSCFCFSSSCIKI